MFKGDNVTVMVSNMDRAVRFYTETLGLKMGGRYGDEWAEASASGVPIGLHPRARRTKRSGTGEVSIGFEVENLDRAVEELQGKGAWFRGRISEDGPLRIAFFADPDGNPLYIPEMAQGGTYR